MNEQLLNLNAMVESMEDTGDRIKFKAGGKTFSFYKTKKDGNSTIAWAGWQVVGGPRKTVAISYKETPYKDGHINSVMSIRAAQGVPNQPTEQKNPPTGQILRLNSNGGAKDDTFWQEKGLEKCMWAEYIRLGSSLTDDDIKRVCLEFSKIHRAAHAFIHGDTGINVDEIPF